MIKTICFLIFYCYPLEPARSVDRNQKTQQIHLSICFMVFTKLFAKRYEQLNFKLCTLNTASCPTICVAAKFGIVQSWVSSSLSFAHQLNVSVDHILSGYRNVFVKNLSSNSKPDSFTNVPSLAHAIYSYNCLGDLVSPGTHLQTPP